jgi:hypothetical protein
VGIGKKLFISSSPLSHSHTLFVWKIYIMGEMRDNVDVHVRKNMPHADAYSYECERMHSRRLYSQQRAINRASERASLCATCMCTRRVRLRERIKLHPPGEEEPCAGVKNIFS